MPPVTITVSKDRAEKNLVRLSTCISEAIVLIDDYRKQEIREYHNLSWYKKILISHPEKRLGGLGYQHERNKLRSHQKTVAEWLEFLGQPETPDRIEISKKEAKEIGLIGNKYWVIDRVLNELEGNDD